MDSDVAVENSLSVSSALVCSWLNDANAAAWAEWRFGAGRGETHVVCVTLGTGIGGGIVTNGRVERGRYGMEEFVNKKLIRIG